MLHERYESRTKQHYITMGKIVDFSFRILILKTHKHII